MAGALTARMYFGSSSPEETELRERADALYRRVDWRWALAGEMINEITLAMVAGIGLRTLSRVIHPYPTQAEAIRKAADACSASLRGPGRRHRRRPPGTS